MPTFDEQIFQPDFPLEGPHLVAASAGTGKTYNIQNIYARLIMEKGLRVSEIQVMTYTEAATKELKTRLRKILQDIRARRAGKYVDPKDVPRVDKLIACLKTAPQRRQADMQLELALQEFDNAAISTIHGFCTRILTKYPFETGTNFNTQIQDDKYQVLAQKSNDWWRANSRTLPTEFQQFVSVSTLRDYVSALAGKADWTLRLPDTPTPESTLLQQAASIVQQYEDERLTRSTQTFDDLLRTVREALTTPESGEHLASLLRNTFKAALIDEFQDTDPIQYDIFKRIFLADDTFPVFFVGDPKQAIYAFRGGDIFTYKRAITQDIPQDQKYTLDVNFRSTPRLITAINDIFRDTEDAYTFDDETIPYPGTITWPQPTDDTHPPAPLKVKNADGHLVDDDRPFKIIRTTGSQKTILPVLCQEIVNTLNEPQDLPQGKSHLCPQDIAVLVSSHATAESIRKMLHACGVPAVLQKSGNVFCILSTDGYNETSTISPTAADFLIFLRSLAYPSDIAKLKKALLTSFAGLTSAELAALDNDTLAQWALTVQEANKLWLTRGLSAALAHFDTAAAKRDGKSLQERLSLLDDAERRLTDTNQMMELIFAAIKEKGTAPDVLLDWLEERINRASDEKDTEEYTRKLETESNAVTIMTMHSSKGLQFPVVFLPECNKQITLNLPYAFHDPERNNELQFSVNKDDAANARCELEQEKTRLLYVAMTRAVQRTVVIYNTSPQRPHPLPYFQTLLDHAQASDAVEFRVVEDIPSQDALPRYEFSDQNTPLRLLTPEDTPPHFDPTPTKGSYSSLSPAKHTTNNDDAKDNDAGDAGGILPDDTHKHHPIFDIRGGATIGSCWHDILEKIPFDADEATLDAQAKDALTSYGFTPESPVKENAPDTYLSVTRQMLINTLNTPITAPTGNTFTLKDIPLTDRLSEQEFDFSSASAVLRTPELAATLNAHWQNAPDKRVFLDAIKNWNRRIPHGFINGFIDLTFRKDNCYYIIDWKSNTLDGTEDSFTAERVSQEMADHGYFFQYLLYAVVLHQYLKSTLGNNYSWEKNFGGIRYVFLRGIAANGPAPVFSDRPSEQLLDDLAKQLGLFQTPYSPGV